MFAVLLDARWPTQIPLEAWERCEGPVRGTEEIPGEVIGGLGERLKPGRGTLLTTRQGEIPHDCEVIVAPSRSDALWQARAVMARAREIGQWEQEQTHASLIPYLLEEAAEVAEEVRCGGGDAALCAELGDVLLQVLFHARIAEQRGAFDFDDVAMSFVRKMRSRAPYLFDGTTSVVPVAEQDRLWAEGKQKERCATIDRHGE
ncbi:MULTISPECIES: MazG nucleotide pyrophosphohydrolase domain-containing protein [unclassified Corynebacterium]|uniref:MazG nucleotide pyrophosphohydrolase domain-containing protein n=1 Tax=unclassified Corynebacterium TaxID=2624378 RepID=UPI0029CA00D4|nr:MULTISPECIES: MazG nucleotide pyrophosphohydrolase domain-containing protein [unclassified Corynebacterium]WPF66870.1 MazG nucleotide pyrophosphohydrolase domain-containing protein [Corynebacterium sp. 22KM0430]WPF69358.1 MazG nucleotide pyrophosphohydrolase domain-containing protein [Corynebacterium sp. 21KM1197]